jgi:virginiamycin A acetyltransferase
VKKIKEIFSRLTGRSNKGISKHGSFKQVNSSLSGLISIDEDVYVGDSLIMGEVRIGKKVKITKSSVQGKINIGTGAKIIDGVDLAGEIEIGRYSSINGPNTDLRCRLHPIRIGNFCSIARNVTFQEFNHDFTRLTSYFVNHNLLGKSVKDDVVSKGPIVIENDVWIGTHSVILSGVTIGTGAVIAANTVITKDVPPYAIVGGNPSKIIKYRFDESTIQQLLASKWWEKPEKEVIEIYRSFGSKTQSEV